MRAVFTVEIPSNNKEFPTDQEVLQLLRSHGWEHVDIRLLDDNHDEKLKKYKELSDILFEDMPEIAVEEKGNVIFFGYIPSDQTKFVVTRVVDGQMTFRLLHPDLARLQASASRVVKEIISSQLFNKHLKIINQTVFVYERKYDHIIIRGRVIPNPLLETLRSDSRNALLTFIPLIIFSLALPLLAAIGPTGDYILVGNLERLTSAMLTTAIVAGIGLFQTFWDIRIARMIAWRVVSGDVLES